MLSGAALHPHRWGQTMSDVDRERTVRRDQRRQHDGGDDHEHERGRGQAPFQAPEAAERRLGRARGAGRLRQRPERDLAVDRRHRQAPTRMRGSMSPTIMSTTKLTDTMIRASSTTAHCTTGKSWFRMDSTVRVATPGQATTVSVMTAPPRSCPNWSPITVITGMHAFRNACLITTIRSDTPLARAVLMYSMFSTSITPERTRRMVIGARKAPSVNAGIRKFCQVPYPEAGRALRRTANTMISMMPSQKIGMA